ncbi:MAG: PTS glucose transporter subunit IIA [Oscillospiraceae bacterium]|nr:PTS glucose transporter subunit IIA [Oscillospiraceae bacterium]
MFDFMKKKSFKIFSPLAGLCIPIEEVQDDVFSQKILGDGIGFKPTQGEVLSPVDGKIIQVVETGHALGIETNNGIEVLLHLGINTVSLKGEGFKVFVKEGDRVLRGQKIMQMDIDFVKSKDFSTDSVLIITNGDNIKEFEKYPGEVIKGETIVASVRL